MRIANPCDWVIERLRARIPFFAVRFNDGEMQCMYRIVPEGKVLGTDANPCAANYEMGDALRSMLWGFGTLGYQEFREGLMIGCSWRTDRADELGKPGGPFDKDVRNIGLAPANWANEHWPLDGVVDGSTVRMLEAVRQGSRPSVLIAPDPQGRAFLCCATTWVDVPGADVWGAREVVRDRVKAFAESGYVLLWAAGCGLKPLAWRLWREFPQSSHVDVGHLFNGAFGMTDYGWLRRKDGPWYEPYFRAGGFADYVRGFIGFIK